MSRLFIHATNVHLGGGRSLLLALLKSLDDRVTFVLSLDERMPIPEGMADNVQIKRVKPSVIERFKAEKWLSRHVASEDIVLCFGNLPPLFKLSGHTAVFVQNRYLIDDVKLNGFVVKERLRITIERLWLSSKMSNVSEFVVQTPTMKRLLEKIIRKNIPIRVLPFVAEPKGYARQLAQVKVQDEIVYDFVYVASGLPHKNHRRLIEAWCLLAEEGLFPSLCMTLDEAHFVGLCSGIEEMRQQYGLKVNNAGELPHQDVLALYKRAGALIYPSTFESFGLPLIEARQASLSILAPELDYIRDILDPEEVFDPESSVSIARAVKRFIGVDEQVLPLLNAREFITCFKK
jgi:glycosyltransferase involved in cell wall biosynthesis